jgi:CheY-like chemotaxis protein
MNEDNNISPGSDTPINIMLADDDVDDRYFFSKVLQRLPLHTNLQTVDNGEKLMQWLTDNAEKLPDVLFLDLNMPRKNGMECLSEIKENEKLKKLPVIIYSTHMHEKDADILYSKGAHYYIRKTDVIELAKILDRILALLIKNNFERPSKDKFVFTGIFLNR